jgi:hypothetical protein
MDDKSPNFIAPKICPFSLEEIAAAIKESEGPGPFYSTQEVLEYLRTLDAPRENTTVPQ